MLFKKIPIQAIETYACVEIEMTKKFSALQLCDK